MFEKKKRGRERIRTAVKGFADPCLATRPRDLLWSANVVEKCICPKKNLKNLKIFFPAARPASELQIFPLTLYYKTIPLC